MEHQGRTQIQGLQPGIHDFIVILTLGTLLPLYVLAVFPTGQEEIERDSSKIQRNTTNSHQLLVLLQWNILVKALNSIMKSCGCGGFLILSDENILLYIQKNPCASRYLDHKCYYGLCRPASVLFHA